MNIWFAVIYMIKLDLKTDTISIACAEEDYPSSSAQAVFCVVKYYVAGSCRRHLQVLRNSSMRTPFFRIEVERIFDVSMSFG